MAKSDNVATDPFADQSSGDPFENTFAAADDVIDLENVSEEAVFETVPAGKYPGVLTGAEYGPTSKGDKNKFKVKGKIASPTREGEYIYLNQTITLTDIGLSQLKRLLIAVAPDAPQRFDPNTLGDLLKDRPALFDVELYRYEGQYRNRIKNVLAPTEDMAFLNS